MITAAVREEVHRRLDLIEREDDVRILFACESGSRAWDFASADSDYDVRFIFVHRRDWYLSVDEGRDVIERAIVDDYDLSGWDVRKALRLFRKSNPPLFEWLGSPIVYRELTPLASRLRALAAERHSPIACAHHYLHMARGNYRDYLKGDEVRTKKYLYVLRPLLAIRWIEAGLGLVPMRFDDVVSRLVAPGPLRAAIDDLVAAKRAGSELDRGPRIVPLQEFIETELARHDSGAVAAVVGKPAGAEELNPILRAAIGEGWG